MRPSPLFSAVAALGALLLLSSPGSEVAAETLSCGPKACYQAKGYNCVFGPTPVDFVFFVDVSGSMQPKIDKVRQGLTDFANSLANQSVSATFTLWDVATSYYTAAFSSSFVTGTRTPWYGPRYRLSQTSSISTFISLLQNGLVLQDYNYRESMLEAIRMALGDAPNNNYNIAVQWRTNAIRVFIILTDEDADPAEFTENVVQADNTIRSTCQADLVSQGRWSAYQTEINRVAQLLINNRVSTYFFVNPNGNSDFTIATTERCLTEYQYGDPTLQVQNSDLTGFDSAATLTKVKANTKASTSLQGALLSNNVPIRVYDIAQVSSSNFVKNFFSAVVQDVSTCSSCYEYTCAANNQCNPPRYICGCDGKPYSGLQTDCAGVCGGSSVTLTDCKGAASCRLPSQAISTDCSGQCYDPLDAAAVVRVTDVCGQCVVKGQVGQKYTSSCSAKPFTDPNLCNYYTCGSQCIPTSVTCLTDCNGTRYPAGTTPPHQLNECSNCRDTADLQASLAAGRDRDNCGVCTNSPGYNASLCNKDCSGTYKYPLDNATLYDKCGVYCGKNCIADCANQLYDNNGTNLSPHLLNTCGTCILRSQAATNTGLDVCGVCTNLPGYNASLCNKDCSGTYQYPLDNATLYDKCGVYCGTKCTRDCANQTYVNDGNTLSPNLINSCGTCIPRSQEATNTGRDACNICTNSASYNASLCNKDCSGTYKYPLDNATLYDKCGVYCGTNCTADCAGELYVNNGVNLSPNLINSCGTCIPRNQSAGNTGRDACNVCTNSPGYNATLCTLNCNNTYVYPLDPNALLDNCGIRCGTQCARDCNGTYYINNGVNVPPHQLNKCGYCIASDQLANDTTGMDKCGVCTNSANYNATYCRYNCKGGYAYLESDSVLRDSCNVLCGNNTRDLCGTCAGNVSVLPYDWSFRQCPCVNGQPVPLVTSCGKHYCAGDPNIVTNCSSTTPTQACDIINPCDGSCYVAGQNATYVIDDCGICYNSSMPSLRNKDMNKCGICFQNDTVCPCTGSNCTTSPILSTSKCGNNVVDTGEECDDGPNGSATCSTTCQKLNGNATGVIAGAVVGAVGGAALIGAGAFIAYTYVKKQGLMASTMSKVEMDSNINPLYQNPNNVFNNPLAADV